MSTQVDISDPLWTRKHRQLRVHAKQRGFDCTLTLRQYIKLAVRAGIEEPDEIGRTRGKYQMSRKGDKGHYVWGNCRFLTIEENQREKIENGGFERGASKVRGRTAATHEGVARTVAARVGNRKETHEYIARMALKKSKPFKVKSPTGRVYSGYNLNEFCEKKGLSRSSLSKVCRGERNDHRGWTGRYL